MRPPPAIELKSVASARARWAVVLLHGLTAAAVAAWACAHAGGAVLGQAVCALASALLVGGAIVWTQRRAALQQHTIRWDGAGWWYAVDAQPAEPVRLQLMLDFGDGIVMRLHPEAAAPHGGARVRWLALESRDAGPGFRALCATLHGVVPAHRSTTEAL